MIDPNEPAAIQTQRPGQQARYTVDILDLERKLIRSSLNIRVQASYDAITNMTAFLTLPGYDILAPGHREALRVHFEKVRLVVGLGSYAVLEFQWQQNAHPEATTVEGQPGQSINMYAQPLAQPSEQKGGFWSHIGNTVESLSTRITKPAEEEKLPLQQLREAKTPMEEAACLRTAGLALDNWLWFKCIPYYDLLGADPKMVWVREYLKVEAKGWLQIWLNAAMGVTQFVDHFLNGRMLDREHNVAKAEAQALAAELSRPGHVNVNMQDPGAAAGGETPADSP